MIPVVLQPEPEEFDELVRKKGQRFLSKFPHSKPTSKQWNSNDYWNEVRDSFYNAYKGICAYSAHLISIYTLYNMA